MLLPVLVVVVVDVIPALECDFHNNLSLCQFVVIVGPGLTDRFQ
jgi:hypothetical protein